MLTAKIRAHIIKLHQKKYRKAFSEFIVDGLKGVKEAVKKNSKILFVIVADNYIKKNKISNFINLMENKGINVYECEKSDINKIKTTATYPGISAVIKSENYELSDLINLKPIIAFDQINDPGNLGAIIRSAHWFNIDNILLSEDSVDPYNDKCVRSSMGSFLYTKFFVSENIAKSLKFLKEKGYKIILLDKNGTDIDLLRPTRNMVYLFGSESHGLRKSLAHFVDKRYTILRKGSAESLNLSVAASILLSKIS